MLMMVSSGLSRYEAQKAQQTVTPRPNTINKASLFLPLLIMTAGVSGLISVITRNWLLTVVIGVLLSMMMAVIVYLLTAATRHQGDPKQTVLVVREGLVRQVSANDLVVGDVLMLTTGEKLPVDVALALDAHVSLPSDLAGLLALIGRQVPAGVGIAGAVMATDVQATVTAVLRDGLVDHAFAQLNGKTENHAPASLVTSAAVGFVLALKQIFRVSGIAVSLLASELLRSKQVNRAQQVRLHADLAQHATLVGAMKHHSKTSDFRHNQDPVS